MTPPPFSSLFDDATSFPFHVRRCLDLLPPDRQPMLLLPPNSSTPTPFSSRSSTPMNSTSRSDISHAYFHYVRQLYTFPQIRLSRIFLQVPLYCSRHSPKDRSPNFSPHLIAAAYTHKLNLGFQFSALVSGTIFCGRIPIRLYLRILGEDVDHFEDVTTVDSWDSISYINRPVEIHNIEGRYITFKKAIKCLLPEFFDDETSEPDHVFVQREDNESDAGKENSEIAGAVMSNSEDRKCADLAFVKPHSSKKVHQIKLIRVQGIEMDLEIPFFWVVNNLKNPEYFLHICVYMGSSLNPA